MSLATLWPLNPPTISGAICGNSLEYVLCLSSERVFGPLAPVGHLFQSL